MTSRRITSGDPLFTFDERLHVLCWNKAAEELTGIPAADAVGRPCWEALRGHDAEGNLVCHAGCSNARTMRQGRPVACQDLVVDTVWGRRSFALSTLELTGPQGRVFVHVLAGRQPAGPESHRARLTPRQQEVLEHLARGIPVKALAKRLGIREATARNHVRAVLGQLGAHSQLEAVAIARRIGLLP